MTLPSTANPLDHVPPTVWVWDGELDAADVAELTDAWQSLLADHPVSVVIDLAAVTFLDCAVLS
ncbi:MAG: STAS domain-containing protein, partial [Janthinobacterium lividum]